MALKIYFQKSKKIKKVSWISLRRNRVPLFMVIYGSACVFLSIIPTITGKTSILTFEAIEALGKFYTFGTFISLLGVAWGIGLNILLPPAPKYVEDTPIQKGGKNVR